jgi:hypothetical protein
MTDQHPCDGGHDEFRATGAGNACASGTTTCWSRSADGSWRDMPGRPATLSKRPRKTCTATMAWSGAWTRRVELPGGPVKPACPLLSEPSLGQGLLAMARASARAIAPLFCSRLCKHWRFESSQSISRRPANPAATLVFPQRLFEAAENAALCLAREGPDRQETDTAQCMLRTSTNRAFAHAAMQCRGYCELWLSLTGPRFWSTMGTLVSVSRASGRNRPTTVAITAHLALQWASVIAESFAVDHSDALPKALFEEL